MREVSGLDDPKLQAALTNGTREALIEDAAIASGAYPDLSKEAFLAGDMTPVYFGSALKNYGVGSLLAALAQHAPAPQPQPAVRSAEHTSELQPLMRNSYAGLRWKNTKQTTKTTNTDK